MFAIGLKIIMPSPFWKKQKNSSLFGGFGSVVRSIAGALMIGLINNGLILMGLEYSQQLIARGVIIILAVTVVRSRR